MTEPERTTPTAAERVEAGAAWLDEHKPDWVDLIDLDDLAMSSCSACVIGQALGTWLDRPDALRDRHTAAALGFDLPDEQRGSREVQAVAYFHLEREWAQLITARREESRA